VYVGNTVYPVISIRSLKSHEGLLLKHLRLWALKESPDAFSPTWEETAGHDDEYWLKSAERIATNRLFDILIAEYDGEAVGLVSGQIDDAGIGHIGAMWADPGIRGKGMGRRLLQQVITYLQDNNAHTIELTVTESNLPAIALYQSAGFSFTGNDVPLRETSALMNREMILTN
jgi:ribosomal protein S18 acetylase RimI-like enzyme